MTTSTFAFGKASVYAVVETYTELSVVGNFAKKLRRYGTAATTARHGSNKAGTTARPNEDPSVQRDLFVDVLTANATKRDARQYLARFKDPHQKPNPTLARADKERNARLQHDQERLDRMGVNLGGLYRSARAIADAPQFIRHQSYNAVDSPQPAETHLAMVSLRNLGVLDDNVIDGLAITLAQFVKLDMKILLVLGLGSEQGHPTPFTSKQKVTEQGLRLARAIARHSPQGARFVPDALAIAQNDISVGIPSLIFDPLERGAVTIVPTLAYTGEGQLMRADTRQVIKAMATAVTDSKSADVKPKPFTLDRIIILDSNGGIPSRQRNDGAHVFVNLEQEFADIRNELLSAYPSSIAQHSVENLDIANDTLSLLPSSSSALVITPEEAAASSSQNRTHINPIAAGTRKRKNTLIHNLLTNKPLVSSSLPAARLSAEPSDAQSVKSNIHTVTLLKKGMPLTIIPGVTGGGLGWPIPQTGNTDLDLERDPRVDLPRLVHLIDDSFRRKLDVPAYLARISGRTAGLIIAGNYEGGAILTWERPPSASASASTSVVPYLDKFAVLQSSQGSAGVADIVFQAMVRTCFPQGVCWRSRKDNPVNKWYFERSAGTWNIPETDWTMFWTGEGIVEDKARWDQYVAVCRGIVPTWADGKRPD